MQDSWNYKLSFRGNGSELFKIWITNLLLIICTLGIYYPWARANMKRYLYSSTYLGDYSFEFHGTGKQMFFGMLKFLLILALLTVMFIVIYQYLPADSIAAKSFDLWTYIPYIPILALFIHGARRFSMSRTSYRGIRFGYRGYKKPLIWLMLKGAFFALCTLGVYYSWLINNIRKYIYGNSRFGNVEAEFSGNGLNYFAKAVGGFFLTLLTLGVYYFWYKKNMFNFFYENLSFKKDGKTLCIKSNATAAKFFELIVINWMIIMFTLGLGYPLAKLRSMKFITENLELCGDMDLDDVIQTEEAYTDATGDAGTDIDSAGDFFDVDIF
ncbi:MAG: YjgN family protein [Fibromonadales bacterium]|nr:YjgN family protein [Fibromonadales bacterium]